MDFKAWKAQSRTASEAVESIVKKASYEDNRFWKLTIPKDGEAEAIIRFLPSKDVAPFIKVYNHVFNNKGQWFIENCPSTIEKDCPVCEYAKEVYDENDKETTKFYRKQQFIANVYIVKDKSNPENDGKVFLFKFGKQIAETINNAIKDVDEPKAPFVPWNGHNFKLQSYKKGEHISFEMSKFMGSASPIFGDKIKVDTDAFDDKLEKIFEQIVDLNEFLDPTKFKNEEDLTTRLNKVLNNKVANKTIGEKTEKAEKTEKTTKKKQSESVDMDEFNLDETEDKETSDDIDDINWDDFK